MGVQVMDTILNMQVSRHNTYRYLMSAVKFSFEMELTLLLCKSLKTNKTNNLYYVYF